MRKIRFFILLLSIFSVFGSIFAQSNRDYNVWFKDNEWLMLNEEKHSWKSLTTGQAKEDFIEKFYAARDPDAFTSKNEFQLSCQNKLETVRKDYPGFSDPRRYIYFLFGDPKSRRSFVDQTIMFPLALKISKGEIWSYDFGGQLSQVIFAKINTRHLQMIRDQYKPEAEDNFLPNLLPSSDYEILYVGPDRYADIPAFLESFFQEGFRIRSTSDILNDLKQPILDRAEHFYKNIIPKVRKEKYKYNWNIGIQVLIDQFDIKSPEEVGMAFWIFFDKDSLSCDAKKSRYSADISLYCEVRNAHNQKVINYCDDSINYKLKTPKAYYHFWGSLPAGKYRVILELGNNIDKRHITVEQDMDILNYSKPGLKASLLVGKIADDPEIIKGKPCYFSLKEGKFYPVFNGECFRDDDEMIVVLDISDFQKNLYGNPYLEIALLFVRGDIQQNKFVSSNDIYAYGFQPIEKDGNRLQSFMKLKVKDLVTAIKLPTGCYKIRLSIHDRIANESGTIDYYYVILILSAAMLKNNLNLLIKGTD